MTSKTFRNTLAFAFSALALVACGQPLGPNAKTDALRGTSVEEPLFQGGPDGKHITIQASALESGKSYRLSNANLTIDGDVPAKTQITVTNGKLHVTGDVGEQATIKATAPTDTHKETYSCMLYNAALKMTLPTSCSRTVQDGLTYTHDLQPAITVDGTLGTNTRALSNAGVKAKCASENARTSTSWGRPITIGHRGNC